MHWYETHDIFISSERVKWLQSDSLSDNEFIPPRKFAYMPMVYLKVWHIRRYTFSGNLWIPIHYLIHCGEGEAFSDGIQSIQTAVITPQTYRDGSDREDEVSAFVSERKLGQNKHGHFWHRLLSTFYELG